MQYRSTRQLVDDLRSNHRLIVVDDRVDPHLELAEIHRRVYRNAGPALLFTNVAGCSFPVATNLFGTIERARFLFRHTLDAVRTAVALKSDPGESLKRPWQLRKMPRVAWNMRPKVVARAASLANEIQVSDLPQVTCWPEDGGPFVTLPQVLSQLPNARRLNGLNLGMYRIQLSGNQYVLNQECGLHYQIHRGIGVHHAEAERQGKSLPITISVGGTPAMTLAAVMPLPEGMSELMFAGALAGHRIPMAIRPGRAPIYADADFVIQGVVHPGSVKPEGPFGDHLGYYAKVHDFPYLEVKQVSHRANAIWPMTVVGRPPQEDTVFGELIHDLTGPVIPTVLPGVREVHAVDAAGVHPLLLAVGSERYTPFLESVRPQELLTQANAILGQGQLSLAKYLFMIDGMDEKAPRASRVEEFLCYLLARVDWRRDLHFQTMTTIDTLDYSGQSLNLGSKLVVACARKLMRNLESNWNADRRLPRCFSQPRVPLPGVLVVEASDALVDANPSAIREALEEFSREAAAEQLGQSFPLLIFADDSHFASQSLANLLWCTFTRSNPATDVYGIGEFTIDKHFGCRGSLVIDARAKPQHAPGLREDDQTLAKVDARAAKGDALARYL